mmetsp:Transcript_9383/g.22894  ORF Transcript_9383/g.22894 Transcript_9383/m.22894 type:complete len:239 (-) Transcript_9383:283-999(-)
MSIRIQTSAPGQRLDHDGTPRRILVEARHRKQHHALRAHSRQRHFLVLGRERAAAEGRWHVVVNGGGTQRRGPLPQQRMSGPIVQVVHDGSVRQLEQRVAGVEDEPGDVDDGFEISALLPPGARWPAATATPERVFSSSSVYRKGEFGAVEWRGHVVGVQPHDVDDVVHPAEGSGGERVWTADAHGALRGGDVDVLRPFPPVDCIVAVAAFPLPCDPLLLAAQVPDAQFLIVALAYRL